MINKPHFELKRVYDNGDSHIRLLALDQILDLDINSIKVTRRGFLGLSLFSTATLLAACAGGEQEPEAITAPPPTSTALQTETLAPTRTSIPTNTPTQIPTETHTPEPSAQTLGEIVEPVADLSCGDQRAHANPIISMVISPDGARIVSADNNGKVMAWATATGELLGSHSGFDRFVVLHHYPTRDVFYALEVLSGNTYVFEDINSAPILFYNEEELLAVSPDGSRHLTYLINDQQVLIRDVNTSQSILEFMGHGDSGVGLAAFSPSGEQVATVGSENEILIWDSETGEIIVSIPNAFVEAGIDLSFDPLGRFIAGVGFDEGTVKLWSASTGELLFTLAAHTDSVFRVDFSPDGALMATGSADQTVKLWNVESTQVTQTLTGHTDTVLDSRFTPDSRYLISSGRDGTIRMWDIESGEQLGICFVDPESNPSDVESITYQSTDSAGITRTYTLPCGAPIPADAICTCNCVAGSFVENPPTATPSSGGSTSGGGGGGGCSCNEICVCIPVFN